jgi:hypothetical protein
MFLKDESIYMSGRVGKCLKSNVHLLRDVRARIGAGFLVCVGSTTKVPIEEFDKIEDPSWKDEMAG